LNKTRKQTLFGELFSIEHMVASSSVGTN